MESFNERYARETKRRWFAIVGKVLLGLVAVGLVAGFLVYVAQKEPASKIGPYLTDRAAQAMARRKLPVADIYTWNLAFWERSGGEVRFVFVSKHIEPTTEVVTCYHAEVFIVLDSDTGTYLATPPRIESISAKEYDELLRRVDDVRESPPYEARQWP